MSGPADPHGLTVREHAGLDVSIGRAETTIYAVSALLLIVAAVFTLVGTIGDLIEGSRSRNIADAGVFVLDRVLLLFIVAELLYTLRVVNASGRILVEPFLFIGIIAVVRKVLVVAAEATGRGQPVDDFALQMAVLAGLVLVLSFAVFLLRRSPGTR